MSGSGRLSRAITLVRTRGDRKATLRNCGCLTTMRCTWPVFRRSGTKKSRISSDSTSRDVRRGESDVMSTWRAGTRSPMSGIPMRKVRIRLPETWLPTRKDSGRSRKGDTPMRRDPTRFARATTDTRRDMLRLPDMFRMPRDGRQRLLARPPMRKERDRMHSGTVRTRKASRHRHTEAAPMQRDSRQ